MSRPKVFGIGFHKTATTSLAGALEKLGYRVTGPNSVTSTNVEANALRTATRLVKRYDAFQDNPWPMLYRDLDQMYPGSKFILTVRASDRWIRSVVDHFGSTTTPMREWIYDGVGAPLGNEDHYVARYERHNAEVREYFSQRPGDLLEIDITRGDGWEPLCSFLDQPIPATPFPTMNRKDAETRHRSLGQKLVHVARKAVPGAHGYAKRPND